MSDQLNNQLEAACCNGLSGHNDQTNDQLNTPSNTPLEAVCDKALGGNYNPSNAP